MEKYFSILFQCPLFYGIGQEDLQAMMACLGAKFIAVPKGDPVFLEGDPAQLVGVVLSGGVQVVQDDYYGNRSVLSILQPGESFGEAFPAQDWTACLSVCLQSRTVRCFS